MRTIRPAPAQAEFDSITIPVSKFAYQGVTWTRLYKKAYPNQFFASMASRLTPISGKFPCVYLGASAETAVAEVWGDRFYATRERGVRLYTIDTAEAELSALLTVAKLPALKLCDLTALDSLLAVGIDAAALYAPDLKVPQGWAEVIAWHPAGFDGIVYRSRHTAEVCVVLWHRPGGRALDKQLLFDAVGSFLQSASAYAVAQKLGLKLAFAV